MCYFSFYNVFQMYMKTNCNVLSLKLFFKKNFLNIFVYM